MRHPVDIIPALVPPCWLLDQTLPLLIKNNCGNLVWILSLLLSCLSPCSSLVPWWKSKNKCTSWSWGLLRGAVRAIYEQHVCLAGCLRVGWTASCCVSRGGGKKKAWSGIISHRWFGCSPLSGEHSRKDITHAWAAHPQNSHLQDLLGWGAASEQGRQHCLFWGVSGHLSGLCRHLEEEVMIDRRGAVAELLHVPQQHAHACGHPPGLCIPRQPGWWAA